MRLKKTAAALLAVMIAASVPLTGAENNGISVTANAASTDEDWEYETNPNDANTVKLLRYKGTERDVLIPDKIGRKEVTVIDGARLFGDSPESITSITIPATVTSILLAKHSWLDWNNWLEEDYNPFWNMTSLSSITVKSGNTAYASIDGVLYQKNENGDTETLVCCPPAKTGGHTVPSGVTTVIEGAFRNSKIGSVKLANTITEIPYEAFRSSAITSIDIPNFVTEIDWFAFYDSKNLQTVTLSDSVTTLNKSAFQNCTALERIEIPDSVTKIYDDCFRGCTSLNYVKLSRNCDHIGYDEYNGIRNIFRDCTSLTKVYFPEGVEELGAFVFDNCSSLKTIALPRSLKDMRYYSIDGTYAGIEEPFRGCPIETIYYNGNKNEFDKVIDDVGKFFPKDVYVVYERNFTHADSGVIVTDGVGALPGYDTKEYSIVVTSTEIEDGVRFNISMDDLDQAAFPLGEYNTTVTVKIPVPEGYEDNTMAVTVDGKKIESSMVNGYVTFKADKLNCDFDLTAADVTIDVDVAVEAPDGTDVSGQKVMVTGNGVDEEFDITAGQLELTDIAAGTYTFTFSANNCAPKGYEVTISGGEVTGLEGGVKLHLLGDINGDGVVNTQDVAKANAHVKGTALLEGYDLTCINVNLDQNINVQDVALMNAHAKNTKLLW